MNLQAFPKVELHCHLDGILDRRMVRDIHKEAPTFPVLPEEFERAYPVTDYQSFWKWWDFIKAFKGSLDYFYPILGKHIERLRAQKVLYAEIMIPASSLPGDSGEAMEKIGAFRDWTNQQEKGEIQIEFLVCFGRHRPLETFEKLAESALALHGTGVIAGVALAGPESANPVKPFHHLFTRFHEAGLGIEIHAGEWCGPESVWDALEYGYPDRIGHGVSLFRDPKLVDYCLKRQVHIEYCPTSNLKTGSIPCIEEHPIRKALDLGLNFSVNTDDPGPVECSMESEYELLAGVFGFGERDFQRLYNNALGARFQPNLRIRIPDA